MTCQYCRYNRVLNILNNVNSKSIQFHHCSSCLPMQYHGIVQSSCHVGKKPPKHPISTRLLYYSLEHYPLDKIVGFYNGFNTNG